MVNHDDYNLKAAIRDALGKPAGKPITKVEVAQLTQLNASRRDIADFSGIEYCSNLTGLYLWKNEISDISPLANLTNLTFLRLKGNLLSDESVNTVIPQLEERGVEVIR